MCKFSHHSSDNGLQYGKFSLAPTALAKTTAYFIEGARQNYQFFNSQIAVEAKYCFDINLGFP